MTSSGNKYHGYRTGLYKQGECSPVSKYTTEQIEKVCELLVENRLSRMQISRATGVDDCTVGMILSKDQWTSISDKYDFSNRIKCHNLYDKETKEAAIELLRNMDTTGLTFSDIGRMVGMSRTSVWYLHNKMKNKMK